VSFSSAGTHAGGGEPVDPDLAAALPAVLDTSGFRSRRLTAALLEHFAAATARAPVGLDRDGLLAQVAATRGREDQVLDVPDPYRRGAEAASGCVARLQDLLRTVLPALAS
jgi:protein-tyrosine-phosphatase